MVKKSYKKRGGAIIQGAEQLNETTTTDDINNEPMVNKDEPMVNKDEPMVNKDEPMVNKNEPLNKNEPMVKKDEPASNEPKKFVDPTGKEWCECPPPKTAFTRLESAKNFGKNANDAVKNFQDNAIKNVTDTLSQKSQDFKKKMSDKAFNIVGNIFGNKEKTVEVNAPSNDVIVGGKRRSTRKHKHSKHRKNKSCTRKHKHKHKNKNCTRKHKHKHSKHKHSKHKHKHSKH
jgi:hypothetical protein